MRTLIVLSRSSPPEICGMSDYCYNIAIELQAYYKKVEFGVGFLPKDLINKEGSPKVVKWSILLDDAINSKKEFDILLNYTPTAYSTTGLHFDLIWRLKKLKKINKNNRLYIHIHELWNNSRKLKIHHKVLNYLFAIAGKSILNLADEIATFTLEQQNIISSFMPDKSIHHALIGTNIIPENKNTAFHSKRNPGVWVIFGLPHTRLWTLEKYRELLKECYELGIFNKILSIGPIDLKYSKQELNLAQSEFGKDILFQTGSLSTFEVSKHFLSAELAFIGQNSNSLTKSGSFASLAAHAVPVVCEVSTDLEDPPGEYIVRPSELINDIQELNLQIKSKALHEWFWKNRSWEAIGQNFYYWMKN